MMVQASLQKIKPTGEGFSSVCPLHKGERPTFNINSDSGLWRCWNPDCDRKGNLVQFLSLIVGMPYADAVEYAQNIPVVSSVDIDIDGWKLPDYDKRWASEEPKFMQEAALGLYSKCPVYMLNRGFTKPFLREFDIGWDENGYEHPEGSGRVLGAKRVTFPVRDPYGRLLGLTRRTVESDGVPKYLHDFERNKTLYLIHLVKRGGVIGVSEGNPDALMARQRAREIPSKAIEYTAMHNMTATLGGSITHDQASLLAMYEPEAVVLGFDNDPPGVSATKKSIKTLREFGFGEILCLRFPSHDLGDLTSEQIVDIDCVSSIEWLRSSQ